MTPGRCSTTASVQPQQSRSCVIVPTVAAEPEQVTPVAVQFGPFKVL